MNLRNLLLACFLFSLTACNSQSGADAGAKKVGEQALQKATYADLSPSEFSEKMKGSDVVILDVRTPGEVARGKIDGSVNIDYREANFAEELGKLDPDKTYLVYCAAGGRSSKACELLVEHGATEVYNLDGGYGAWPK